MARLVYAHIVLHRATKFGTISHRWEGKDFKVLLCRSTEGWRCWDCWDCSAVVGVTL